MSKDTITKKQHFVPQFYLKNFITNKNLFVFDRQKNSSFECSPKDICYKNYLYESEWQKFNPKLGKFISPNEIEKNFSSEEREYNRILKNIISRCLNLSNKNLPICDNNESKILAEFVTNMLVRNPWTLQEANIDSISSDLMKNPEIITIDKLLKEIGLGNIEALLKATNKYIWLDNKKIIGNVPTEITNKLLMLNYSILSAETPSFVTSSFPIIFELYDGTDGITYFRNLYIPIHPKLALLYSNIKGSSIYKNRIVPVSKDKVSFFNHLFLKTNINQTRFIISHDLNVLKQLLEN